MTPDFPDKPLSDEAQRRLEVATARSYCLQSDAAPDEELRRVARGRVDAALERLRRDATAEPARAVHETRKDLKKLRSLLRLVREGLGERTYRTENGRYRDAARLLSAPRDAEVKLKTLTDLLERDPDEAPAAGVLRAALEQEREQLAGTDEGSDLQRQIEQALEAIATGGAEIERWELTGEGFDLVGAGLKRAYGRGRGGLRRLQAEPSDEAVHEWRKRVKDLWYQLRILRNTWPGPLEVAAEEAHKLSDLLGDHHDLAVLVEDALERAPDDAETQVLTRLARDRQRELLDAAIPIGERLYAEKPEQFRRRVKVYWQTWARASEM